MSQVLFLDLGNSRLKWWYCEASEDALALLAEGVFDAADVSALRAGLEQYLSPAALGLLGVCDSVSVCYASVASHQKASVMQAFFNTHHLSLTKISVENTFAGLSLAYKDVGRLGVDRWLAMIGALVRMRGCNGHAPIALKKLPSSFSQSGAFIVVDAGSAITVDFVGLGGDHQGGLIFPGFGTLAESLNLKTAFSFSVSDLSEAWRPGVNSSECVQNGLVAVLKGLLGELQNFRSKSTSLRAASSSPAALSPVLPSDAVPILFTGGDGEILSRINDVSCVDASGDGYFDNLIFLGLVFVYYYRQASLGQ